MWIRIRTTEIHVWCLANKISLQIWNIPQGNKKLIKQKMQRAIIHNDKWSGWAVGRENGGIQNNMLQAKKCFCFLNTTVHNNMPNKHWSRDAIIYMIIVEDPEHLNKIKSMDEHARTNLQKVESLKLQWDSNTTRFLFFLFF